MFIEEVLKMQKSHSVCGKSINELFISELWADFFAFAVFTLNYNGHLPCRNTLSVLTSTLICLGTG